MQLQLQDIVGRLALAMARFAALIVALLAWQASCNESMPDFDLYAALELSPTASTAAVRKAYKAMARRFHPDRNKDEGAQERFVRAQLAYETLSDSDKRRDYDEYRATGRQRNEPSSWQGNSGGGYRMYTFVGPDGRQYVRRVWEGAPPTWAHQGSGRTAGAFGISSLELLLLLGCAMLGVHFLLGGGLEKKQGGLAAAPAAPVPPSPPTVSQAGRATAEDSSAAARAGALRGLVAALELAVSGQRQRQQDGATQDEGPVPRPLPAVAALFSPGEGAQSAAAAPSHSRQAVVAVLRLVRAAAPGEGCAPSSSSAAASEPASFALDEASQGAYAALCALTAALRHDPVVIAWLPSPDSLPLVEAALGRERWGCIGSHLSQWSKRVARLGRGTTPAAIYLRWRPGADTARAACFDGGAEAGGGGADTLSSAVTLSAAALLKWGELLLQGGTGSAQLVDATDVMQPLLAGIPVAAREEARG